jgi:hypothetical protein
MAATLLIGALPTFRAFLVVHLFLVDSFLAYICLLAHAADRAARTFARPPEAAFSPEDALPAPASASAAPVRRWKRTRVPVPTALTQAHI